MIIWIIGLSGSGKTTLGLELCKDLRILGKKVVLLDGDKVREIFSNDLGHGLVDREKNADRIYNLGQFLAKQGIDVVCPILSIFEKHRKLNRNSSIKYFEIFIDTPMEILEKRDSKGLYNKYKEGLIQNVAGKDLNFPIPVNPDLIINNTKTLDNLLSYSKIIIKKI